MKSNPGIEIPAFDPNPRAFTGPSFDYSEVEEGNVEEAQRAIRTIIRRFRRARSFDPCLGIRLRPRQAARRRREQRRRASNSSRGDPDPHLDVAALVASIEEADGKEPLDLTRAAFVIVHDWDWSRFHRTLDRAVERGEVFTFDNGEDVWIVRRGVA